MKSRSCRLDIKMPRMNNSILPRRWFLTPLTSRLRTGFVRLHRHFSYKTRDLVEVRNCVERQHLVLLGAGFFLLICWVLVSIWLINIHNGKKSHEEEVPALTAAIVPCIPSIPLNYKRFCCEVNSYRISHEEKA